MNKGLLVLLALLVIVITAFLTLFVNIVLIETVPKSEIDTAVNQAKYLYSLKKATGEDLKEGPCLSDALMPDWVVDIAHNPRQPVDDLPGNQCPSFREGRVKHFVELDLEGNLIKAR